MKAPIFICIIFASSLSSSIGNFDNITATRYAERFTNSARVLEKLIPSKSVNVRSVFGEKDLVVANSFGLGHYSRHHYGGFGGYPGHYGHGHFGHHHRFFNPYYGSYGGYFRHHNHFFQGHYGHHYHQGFGGHGYPGFGINYF